MLSKEELRVLIEREGIPDFIYATDAFEYQGKTIYEMENDYYAVMFRIFPPAYCGPQTEAILQGFLTCGLPKNTVVQFTTFSSRNMQDHVYSYKKTHGSGELSNLENSEILKQLELAQVKFLETHADETVPDKSGLQFYLRDFINLVTLQFPLRGNDGSDIKFDDIVSYINKAEGTLGKFAPINFSQDRYIRLLREMITPYDPLWNASRDPSFPIKDHVCNADSMLEDVGDGILKLSSTRGKEVGAQERDEEKKSSPLGNVFKKIMAATKFKDYQPIVNTSDSTVKNKEYFVKIFSRKMFPEYMDLHTSSDLLMDYFNQNVQQQIPVPYIVNLTVMLEDPEDAIKAVKSDSQWNMYQLEHSGRLAKFFPELAMRAEEANGIVNLIERDGEIPMKAMWSMVLYGTDRNELQRHASFVKGAYRQKNWILQDEDLISIPMFLYSLPGQYHEVFRKWSKRYSTIFKSNAAAIAPIVTDSRGFGDPVLQLTGRNGQVQGFDLYAKMAANKNAILVGPSGKGKSFAMSKLIWSYLNSGENGKPGAKIRVIDSGHSYRTLCDLLGGQYITFPEGNEHCLNFFTTIVEDDDGNLPEDDIGNIVGLIGVMAGLDLNGTEGSLSEKEYRTTISSYIAEAVVMAYKMSGNDAGMHEVGQALRNIIKTQKEDSMRQSKQYESDIDARLTSLVSTLHPFTEKIGQFYKYFNGKSNVDLKKDFVVLDLDDLIAKERRFRDVVFTAITNTISREFYNERHDGRRKLLLVDEAWNLLEGDAGAFILGLYRRSRKLRGSIICISQSILDFHKNEHIRGIFENAFWRLYLEQDPSTMSTATREGKLVLDDYAYKLLETVQTKPGEYSEMMVTTQVGSLMIGRILATRVEYWINAQEEEALTAIEKVKNTYDVKDDIARMAIGFSEMNHTSLDDEVARLLGVYERAIKELLEEEAA